MILPNGTWGKLGEKVNWPKLSKSCVIVTETRNSVTEGHSALRENRVNKSICPSRAKVVVWSMALTGTGVEFSTLFVFQALSANN